MSEKEFIKLAMRRFYELTWPELCKEQSFLDKCDEVSDKYIPIFLEEFHKEYYEVEFIKLFGEEDDNEWGVDPPGGKIYG